jgi:hypothetical protein
MKSFAGRKAISESLEFWGITPDVRKYMASIRALDLASCWSKVGE